MSASWRRAWVALRTLLVLTVIVGVAYPLAVTLVAQAFLRHQADGSMITVNGRVVGSAIIGQSFTDANGAPLPQWFQPRPSAAGAAPGYNAMASGASNLGPSNEALVTAIEQRREAVAAFNHVAPSMVPPDAVTASGSGLDPDISVAYADIQIDRVAAARHVPASEVAAIVRSHIVHRQLGVLGTEHVDVLVLNAAVAALGS
jgi:K+-transporting ATPase ATPase C chain